ncbi:MULTISPECIES: CdaR family transcriptional regulator [unclassified Arthrobacter]|uniref:PucR family transcriptional regulator n=1 Tax=unclassified Arthrobacter TaxID=235627 RepID=UPI00159D0C8A|nr:MULTISPECIES: helix-turn-helix domain-containing protein [unclassified Arthrobacter]MCQ9163127.1 helix-turn-helix domain-containing protein [Arthrobacter sp. STN4]NVM99688.1 PucR family transcriptional regulator [Arthrobacter sp. SDTb3-6]
MAAKNSGTAAAPAAVSPVPKPARERRRPGQAKASPETLQRLRATIGPLSTTMLRELENTLPWYRRLSADERSTLGLVAQNGIAAFVSWYEQPSSPSWVLSDVFGTAPTELTRSISLQRALQLIRTVVQVVEDRVPELAAASEQVALREAVLRYSREVAFAAADVYARAAENRGAWDTRLEALAVDGIQRGENPDALQSRISALGWTSHNRFTIMVGPAPAEANATFLATLRRAAGRFAADVMVGIQGDRLILVLGNVADPETAYLRLSDLFAAGPVVYGPLAATLADATASAQAAFAGMAAAKGWTGAPRPVSADDLWPERVMAGDDSARRALVAGIYQPLVAASNGLVETLNSYLELGHSLEAAARDLFVHSNTVRYRLRRVCDVTGWDPLVPREAFVLQTALVVGRLAAPPRQAPERPAARG